MLDDIRRYLPFSDLPEDDLALLAPIFAPLAAPTDMTLFRQGQAAEQLYLVVEGQVGLRYKPYDGPEMGLTHVRTGGAVGWSSVTGGPKYTATAVTSLRSELLMARGADLQKFVADHPLAGRRVLDRLASAVSPRWAGAHGQVLNLLARNALAAVG